MAKVIRQRSAKKKVSKSSTPPKHQKSTGRATLKYPPRRAQGRTPVSKTRLPEKRPVKRLMVAERDPQAVKLYETALKSFNSHEFARAREAFQRVIDQSPKEPDIVERARVHLAICQQRLAKGGSGAKTAEDFYNMAIAHLNRRDFEEAQSSLEKALALDPRGDHIIYGMAALDSLRGRAEQALKHLQRAIQLNPLNRTAAMNDPDFEPMAKSAEFQALVRGTSAEH
jgi:tetratricopeptide (TPR) repeat protein